MSAILCRQCGHAIEYHPRTHAWVHRTPGADHPPRVTAPQGVDLRDLERDNLRPDRVPGP